MSDVVPVLGPPISSRLGDGWNLCTLLPPNMRQQGRLSTPRYGENHSSSEISLPRKCAMTTGAVDFEGLMVFNESIDTKRRGVPWRLPKFE